MTAALIWHRLPDANTAAAACQAHRQAALVVLCGDPAAATGYLKTDTPGFRTIQTCAAGAANYLPAKHNPYGRGLWLLPAAEAPRLAAYGFRLLYWQDSPPAEQHSLPQPPWLQAAPLLPPDNIVVVGAGIAGAATAYALARRGLQVTVLEQAAPAQAASGNHQGLLYAKISPHPTAQTRLLLAAYGFSLRLLAATLDPAHWQACGVLHLNHNAAERRRNAALAALAAQTANRHLYYPVSAEQAAALAGTDLNRLDGLFWPQGAWIHPPAWVAALLAQPNIRLLPAHRLDALHRSGSSWQLSCRTPAGKRQLQASHVVFCTGADALPNGIAPFPLHAIRGQTSLAAVGAHSPPLRCALSGGSYVAPAYRGRYCFGASFVPHDRDQAWRPQEDLANRQALSELAPDLHRRLGDTLPGHTALRADCHDHLPAVGPLGDYAAMQIQYAKLADDRRYPFQTPCPYLPGIFLNTAHGSRGLTTAPLCGELIAAQILGQALPLPPDLAAALAPNRVLARRIALSKSAS
ncbi:MAG: FAD-dependent 5-carboxymethylaminomethyl-2-thiouridine(34) oxidoreductase MnmC [Eikenella sp.]|nr:FAD-dependent 5-carboxymethylaminomethyl-2-thiouridine(34) oxidoreductase MnmC [Eikenella sp.]